MITYSQFNRRITGQVCCCIGPTGPQGPTGLQGPTGPQGATGPASLQTLNVTTGIDKNYEKHSVAYDVSNILLLNNASSEGDGFNLRFVEQNTFTVLPFGGDISNNAPLDNSNNPVQLNHSSWLKIQLYSSDWSKASSVKPDDNIAYIPMYWYKP